MRHQIHQSNRIYSSSETADSYRGSWLARYYRRKNIVLLLLIVLSPVIVDALRTVATGGISSIIRFASQPVHNAVIPSNNLVPQLSVQFASFRANLLDSTEHYLGGLFGNFIILALGIY
jgi:hypothetical protein